MSTGKVLLPVFDREGGKSGTGIEVFTGTSSPVICDFIKASTQNQD